MLGWKNVVGSASQATASVLGILQNTVSFGIESTWLLSVWVVLLRETDRDSVLKEKQCLKSIKERASTK